MTKKLNPLEKKNRKPAQRACTFCHSKHLQCSNERPCQNCLKRNIGDQCQDVTRKRAKYLKIKKEIKPNIELGSKENVSELESLVKSSAHSGNGNSNTQVTNIKSNRNDHFLTPQVPMMKTTDQVLNKILYLDPTSQNNDSHINMSDELGDMFNSNYLSQEYLKLGDIILHSKPSSPSPSNTSNSDNVGVTVSPSSTFFSTNMKTQDSSKSKAMKDSRPFISLGFNEHSNGVAGKNPIIDKAMDINSTEYISPLISHHLYQSVQDIYSNNIINFDYPQSYHLLTTFLKKRFLGKHLSDEDRQSKRRNFLVILKLIASYRPTFISAHKSLLKPFDLQFLEMSFQRSLLDYERLLQLNSSPTIIWRRTGEIVSISDDLLSLLGFSLSSILSKRTYIIELMYDDESIVRYFELFKSVAVGNLHLRIITRCKLMKNSERAMMTCSPISDDDQNDFIEFSSVWTVKRDLFDLPMLIIGQFLPILPAGEGVRMY
ncbi:uncharacterized protein PRCAT00001498001 [Priceomyces carsonii]|uniref:uncharacterized protein n=1 Tax=Priceomyces carsonii TaxID=28549 RepID=UPI002EDA283C|nr:unnamed protein product [Priceomyces carsonii]